MVPVLEQIFDSTKSRTPASTSAERGDSISAHAEPPPALGAGGGGGSGWLALSTSPGLAQKPNGRLRKMFPKTKHLDINSQARSKVSLVFTSSDNYVALEKKGRTSYLTTTWYLTVP